MENVFYGLTGLFFLNGASTMSSYYNRYGAKMPIWARGLRFYGASLGVVSLMMATNVLRIYHDSNGNHLLQFGSARKN